MNALLNSLSRRPLRVVALTVVLAAASSMAMIAEAAPPHDVTGGRMMMGAPGQVDRWLDAANASAEQRKQVKAIMDAARADMRAQHEAAGPLHQQMMQLFVQPAVDANAAEGLRQQMLAQHDQGSRRMLQAMLELSRVLTPEQRQQIADKMAQQRAAMGQHRKHDTAAPATK